VIDTKAMREEIDAIRGYLIAEFSHQAVEHEFIDHDRDFYCFRVRLAPDGCLIRVTDEFLMTIRGPAVTEFLRRHRLVWKIQSSNADKALLVTSRGIVEEPV
jgi:hypothetical protein